MHELIYQNIVSFLSHSIPHNIWGHVLRRSRQFVVCSLFCILCILFIHALDWLSVNVVQLYDQILLLVFVYTSVSDLEQVKHHDQKRQPFKIFDSCPYISTLRGEQMCHCVKFFLTLLFVCCKRFFEVLARDISLLRTARLLSWDVKPKN